MILVALLTWPITSWSQVGHKVTFENAYFGKRIDITAHLSYPDERKDRYPVMIIVPSSGDLHERDWENAEMLNQIGVATLVIDSLGSRGIKNLARNKRAFSDWQAVTDVESAIRFLSTQPNIDSSRIGSMGRSLGGATSLLIGSEDWREKAKVRSAKPALILAIYPGCITTRENPRSISPVVFFLGGKDDITPASHCIEYAERMKAAGSDVEWIVYPDAFHSFDVRATPFWASQQENFSACRSVIPRELGAGLYRSDTNQLLKGDEIEKFMAGCRTVGGWGGGSPQASKEMDERIMSEVRKHLLRN